MLASINLPKPLIAAVVSFLFAAWAWAHPGDGLVVDAQGTIYFGFVHPLQLQDSRHEACVWKLASDGGAAPVVKSDHPSSNIWVSLGRDGRIYAVERHYLGEEAGRDAFESTFSRLNDGERFTRIRGPERGRFAFGAGAYAVDEPGILFHASDGRMIHRTRPNGETEVFAGGQRGRRDGKGTKAQFQYITRLAWGPDKTLYVYDEGSIRIVGTDGAVTTLAENLDELDSMDPVFPGRTIVLDLQVDEAGNAFVADYGNRRVLHISADGDASILYTCEAPWSPEGIAVSGGDLYVLECTTPESGTMKPRIRKRGRNGEFSTLFKLPE